MICYVKINMNNNIDINRNINMNKISIDMQNILVDRVGTTYQNSSLSASRCVLCERVVDRASNTYKNSSVRASRCVSCERAGRQSCPENLSKTRVLARRHAFRVRGSSIGFRKRTKTRVFVLEVEVYFLFDPFLFIF